MKATASQKHDTWAQHIGQWSASGQTQADYCREHDLKLHQFTYWRGKLKADREAVTHPRELSRAFVPVALETRQPSGLVICLANGCRIEGLTPGTLPMVPQLLELLR